MAAASSSDASTQTVDGFFFNRMYFSMNIDKLIALREYVRENPEFHPSCHVDCVELRIRGLNLLGPFSNNMDMSLGDCVKSFGGPTKLARKGYFYFITETTSTIAIAYLMKLKENKRMTADDLFSMERSDFQKIVDTLFEHERGVPEDKFAEHLEDWVSLPKEQLRIAIKHMESDMGPNFMEYYEDACRVARFYLMKTVVRAPNRVVPRTYPEEE